MSLYRRWVGLDKNGLSRSSVESRVEALLQAVRPISAVEVERNNGLITFFFPREPPLICPDPVLAVFSPLEGYRSPVACRISPGRLTADNVLVDEAKQAWLTDFVCAGQAPQWWDYLCLEAIIRFDLSHAPDLLAWLDFEECLVGPSRLDERLRVQDVIADLRTSLVLIEQIRRKAGSEVGPDTLPYHAGLLAWVVGAMARHDPETLYTHEERMRAAHLLLSAARLAWRMSEKFSPSQPGGTLRFESDGSVWVGDRRIQDLMGQELALLRCLYERPGQAVSRQLIVQVVFEEEYDASDKQQESRVNSLVRRLRVRIEPNPDRARYVLTEKGRGYRLEVESKSQD
jgi:DNA-binding winged helix-turn-helix (wHTH) protein